VGHGDSRFALSFLESSIKKFEGAYDISVSVWKSDFKDQAVLIDKLILALAATVMYTSMYMLTNVLDC